MCSSTNDPSRKGMMGQKSFQQQRSDWIYFEVLQQQNSCIRHTCTHTMHKVFQPICQGGRQGFKNSLIAEWLHWLHGWNVDIFVAINHQAQSGCIQEQPRHPSTPLLLSASPPSISSVMKPSILGFPSASIFPLQVSLFIAHLVKTPF